MKSCNLLYTSVLCVCVVFSSVSSNAQFWKKIHKKEIKGTTEIKKQTEYEKLLGKKHEKHTGLFNIYKFKKDNKIFFELPLNLIDRDFLLASTISATSDAGDGIVGQKPHDPIHFKFGFENERVQMLLPNNGILNSKESSIQKALEYSNISPTLKSFKVKCYNNDSTSVLIDVTDFFAGNEKMIDPFDRYSKNTLGGAANRSATFQKNDSYIKGIKNFKDNVSIKSVLSYKTSLKYAFFSISQNVPFIAEVTRTILLLPKKTMRHRYADPRIGIFYNYKKQYTTLEAGSKKRYITNRWRLEPVDVKAWEKGEIVKVKKPIVFYVDNNYPESWKKYVFEGVTEWQKAFEKIGFKDAIVAKPFPTKEEDPNFDPDNLKYSCLRYSPIDVANSMGPSWIDPRSGEIVNASVYSYHDVSKLLRNWRFVQTAQCDKSVRTKKMDEKIFGDALKYVITHEVGHCLGLMHNMSASAAIPTDSLRSPSFTQKYGTTYSVMDYARFNYVAQPGDLERGVKLTPPSLGLYDFYAIKWLYNPIPKAKTVEEEIPVLDKYISEKSGNPIYRYGKQQIKYNYDPSSLTEDLGDDLIKSNTYGIKNLKYIMKNFNDWIYDEDKDMEFRNQIYTTILNQYSKYLNHVVAHIGGIYLNETYEGDLLSKCVVVSKAKQKAALTFLFKEINSNKWLDNIEVNKFLNFDIPVVQILNKRIYEAILEKDKNIRLASYKVVNSRDKYTVKEYLNDVYKKTWRSLFLNKKLTENEKLQQASFIDYLLKSADIVKKEGGSRGALFGIADNISYSNEVEKAIKKYDFNAEDSSKVEGFEFVRKKKVNKINIDPSIYYEFIIKIKSAINSKIKICDISSRAHYKLMLMKINNAIKK